MAHNFKILFDGIVLGMGAGISPGPLMIAVITYTVTYGFKEGFRISLAPFLTDLPILFMCYLVLTIIPHADRFISCLSLVGSLFLAKMAYDNWHTEGLSLPEETKKRNSIKTGILANFLSPHPYVFWITIGIPILLRPENSNIETKTLFVAGMIGTMVLMKVLTAGIIHAFSIQKRSVFYKMILKTSSVTLMAYAVSYFWNAISSFTL